MKKTKLIILTLLGVMGCTSPQENERSDWGQDSTKHTTTRTTPHTSIVPWYMFWRSTQPSHSTISHPTTTTRSSSSKPSRGGFGSRGSKSSAT